MIMIIIHKDNNNSFKLIYQYFLIKTNKYYLGKVSLLCQCLTISGHIAPSIFENIASLFIFKNSLFLYYVYTLVKNLTLKFNFKSHPQFIFSNNKSCLRDRIVFKYAHLDYYMFHVPLNHSHLKHHQYTIWLQQLSPYHYSQVAEANNLFVVTMSTYGKVTLFKHQHNQNKYTLYSSSS